MSLNLDEIARLARLARIELSAQEAVATRDKLNGILALIDELQATDTTGVTPMSHAMDLTQRLRADRVTESDSRQAFQTLAPEVEGGLYLVPKVVE